MSNLTNQELYSIKDQTEDICKSFVSKDGLSLRYVNSQTDEICRIAVRQNGFAYQFIKNKTEELFSEAVRQNKKVLKYREAMERNRIMMDNN
jgi:hypothetical protein